MKKLLIIISLVLMMNFVSAQNAMWIYNSDGTITTYKISEIDSLNFTPNMINMLLYQNGATDDLTVAGIDSIVFRPADDIEANAILIEYNNDIATVRHNITSEYFNVNVNGADVEIISEASIEGLQYYLSGTTTNGSFSLESDMPYDVILNNTEITSLTNVPLNLSKNVERNIIIANELTASHADWAEEFIKEYDEINAENAMSIIEAEVGKVFAKVLEHAGVYKRNEEGKAAFLRFVESV